MTGDRVGVSYADMSSDANTRRYVSTFRMDIKPPQASSGQGKATGVTTRNTRFINSTVVTTEGSSSLPHPTNVRPPIFTEPIKDCSVNEGTGITLRGVLTGSQPILVSWLHNGEEARFGRSFFDGREARFVVTECLPEDAGAYTCLAENEAGKTSCCAAVFVRDFETLYGQQSVPNASPCSSKSIAENGGLHLSTKNGLNNSNGCSTPTTSDNQSPERSKRGVIPKRRASSGTVRGVQFESPPQHVEAHVGEAVRLTCAFTGSPPVLSCWIRNKEQIVDGAELWVEHSERNTTLVIAEAKAQHTGCYTIVLKDRKSSAQHTLTLSVIDKPQPPASCPVVSLLSTDSLVLSWSGPCYDGGSAVLGYVVEVKRHSPAEAGDWSELSSQCVSTSYRVCAVLDPQTDYRFRVLAFNVVGISEPSPASAVVRMEQAAKQQEEVLQKYADVKIDSTHKVTDHYNVLEKLGVGKFGQVFKLTHKETGLVCAGKFYKGRRAKEREAARKEIELMNFMHHPKLVQCLAAYDNRPEMVMVMEFIAGGELFERIVDDSFEHTESASIRYMQQILQGVAFMHEQSIIHLDLKPENIVCVDHTGTAIKIIDFGLASKLDKSVPLKVMHGTPEFVAPEVINYEPVCPATDMWSIGVICYILLSGESPFQGNSDTETLALVTAAKWEFDEESFEEITEQAKDFISSLLNKDTRQRLSCKKALEHPWIAALDTGDQQTAKSLSKQKMKRFLARQKWKKAGKAMLALKRMAIRSKAESQAPPTSPGEGSDTPMTPEAENALQSLELKMQGPPRFSQSLQDQAVAQGSSAHLSCHLTGYPDPEVVWMCGDEPVHESSRVQIEYEEDGRCTLILANVCPEDTHVYTCRATNDHGEALSSAKLTVTK